MTRSGLGAASRRSDGPIFALMVTDQRQNRTSPATGRTEAPVFRLLLTARDLTLPSFSAGSVSAMVGASRASKSPSRDHYSKASAISLPP